MQACKKKRQALCYLFQSEAQAAPGIMTIILNFKFKILNFFIILC